jgi:hypothetical protein
VLKCSAVRVVDLATKIITTLARGFNSTFLPPVQSKVYQFKMQAVAADTEGSVCECQQATGWLPSEHWFA